MFYASRLRDFSRGIGEAKRLTSKEGGRYVYAFICADSNNFYEVGEEIIVEDRLGGSLGKIWGNAINLAS